MSVEPPAEVPVKVPDEALRPALELAVGVAAAGVKLRPPLAFPSGLKRFLRFHKLPPAALSEVRAAVEGDDAFRGRLASVATADLVDEVGVLWLSRPDGWDLAITELIPEQAVDDQAALRREERRRLAAQEAAARGRAELLAMTAELDRERAGKVAVMGDRDRLKSELDEVRARLRDAQRVEHATAQTLAKAESELATMRLAAAAPRLPTPVVIDTMAVRNLLDGAVAASTDIVALLTDALGELARADSATDEVSFEPARSPRARRKPIRLPGGVLVGTVEAAEFVLRIKGALTLVDGYNVAMLGWPSLDLDHQRDQCTVAAENLAKRWNMAMTIVFDGATVEGAHTVTRRKLRIVYSPAGVSADDVLRAEVAGTDFVKAVVVVTNDRAILADVTAAGANTVSSDDFLTLMRR
ncbi:MAG: NYN domain-containing protein [Ilumatobacteraceae bacterium]